MSLYSPPRLLNVGCNINVVPLPLVSNLRDTSKEGVTDLRRDIAGVCSPKGCYKMRLPSV